MQRSAGNRAVAAALTAQRCGPVPGIRGPEGREAQEEGLQRLPAQAEPPAPGPLGQFTRTGRPPSSTSPRFRGVALLEACYADRARMGPGSTGDPVARVQQALSELGYDLGTVDGRYGPRTAAAVRAFKVREALGSTRYGDVGPGTIGRLDRMFPGGGGPDVRTPPDVERPPDIGTLPPCPHPGREDDRGSAAALAPHRPGVTCQPPVGQTVTDWTQTYHPDTGTVDALPPDQARSLAAQVAAARASITPRTDKRDAGKGLVASKKGYVYNSRGGSLAEAGDDRVTAAAMREAGTEGGVAAVNTWDGSGNLTFGRGTKNEAAALLITRWMELAPSIRQELKDVGVHAVGQVFLAVDEATGQVLADGRPTGNPKKPAPADARLVIRDDTRLLTFLMDLGERATAGPDDEPSPTEALRRAERDVILKRYPLPAFLRTPEGDAWTDAAVAIAWHLSYWLPGAGWAKPHTARYQATHGNLSHIGDAFALSWADGDPGARLPNGAVVVGAHTYNASPLRMHTDHFGRGADAEGALGRLIRSGTRVETSKRAIGTDPALAEHVLWADTDGAPRDDAVVPWFDTNRPQVP